MIRLLQRLVLVSLATATGGCALCANPDDDAYGAYGGIVERHDPYHGRVNSAFAPAGAGGATVHAGYTIPDSAEEIGAGEPTPAEMPEATPEEREAGPQSGDPEAMEPDSPMETPGEDGEPMTPAAPEVFYE